MPGLPGDLILLLTGASIVLARLCCGSEIFCAVSSVMRGRLAKAVTLMPGILFTTILIGGPVLASLWGGGEEALSSRESDSLRSLEAQSSGLGNVGKSDFAFSESCAQVSEGKIIALRL